MILDDRDIELIRDLVGAQQMYDDEMETDELCDMCGGTGEVVMGQFDDLQTKPCLCTATESDEYEPSDRD